MKSRNYPWDATENSRLRGFQVRVKRKEESIVLSLIKPSHVSPQIWIELNLILGLTTPLQRSSIWQELFAYRQFIETRTIHLGYLVDCRWLGVVPLGKMIRVRNWEWVLSEQSRSRNRHRLIIVVYLDFLVPLGGICHSGPYWILFQRSWTGNQPFGAVRVCKLASAFSPYLEGYLTIFSRGCPLSLPWIACHNLGLCFQRKLLSYLLVLVVW